MGRTDSCSNKRTSHKPAVPAYWTVELDSHSRNYQDNHLPSRNVLSDTDHLSQVLDLDHSIVWEVVGEGRSWSLAVGVCCSRNRGMTWVSYYSKLH